MNSLTTKAIELCRAGYSPSDATVLATMGRPVTPAAINRIESIVAADFARLQRKAAKEVRS